MTDNIAKRNPVQLAMFAKYWEAGRVKTRLARSIGEDAARDVHLLFVRFLLEKFQAFGDSRSFVGSPVERQSEFEKILPSGWNLQFQSDGDLGQRMSNFFKSNQQSDQFNILIGSDTPDVPESYLQQCIELLKRNQLVLGPSLDGGYYLIAMKNHQPPLFENVVWSSPEVFSRTLEIAKQNSVSVALLPKLNDVDELDDLKQLLTKLEQSDDALDQTLYRSLTDLELKVG